jgi:hypothetical protein
MAAAGAVVSMFVAALPWLWARRVEAAALDELIRRHGDDFAIIEMHIDGNEGERLNLYDKLWYQVTTRREAHGTAPYTDAGRIYGSHHLAVLVSDNQKTYLYYWSLRSNRLVLGEERRVNALALTRPWSDYLYRESDCDRRRGVRWKRNPDGHEIVWYHPSWELRPHPGTVETGGGRDGEWEPMPRLPRDH